MNEIIPFQNWLHLYDPEEDEKSIFFHFERNEMNRQLQIYNYIISPFWDEFDSWTLYGKHLWVDYEEQAVIIELVGEWNDTIENDIMNLKRNWIDALIRQGICKFIIIGENVLNFHSSDLNYYEEWQEDVAEDGGFIVLLNLPEHTQREMRQAGLGNYFFFMQYEQWRIHEPLPFFQMIEDKMLKLL